MKIRTGNSFVNFKADSDDIIKFEFVSRLYEPDSNILKDNIYRLPQKGSKNAAGYDFFNPERVEILPGEIKYVKTGIKAKFPENMALLLLNRSSNPKKKGLIVANGIGLIDADYYNNSDNEGEMAFAFQNITNDIVVLEAGEKLGQGMFIKYYDVTDYNSDGVAERKGGFGSTGE